MKIFSFLFVVIILALNLVPCADAQETIDLQGTAVHLQADVTHTHPFTDTCSPFCHCSCCANSSVAQLLHLSSVPFTEYQPAAVPYTAGNYIDVSLPIWQPPQWS